MQNCVVLQAVFILWALCRLYLLPLVLQDCICVLTGILVQATHSLVSAKMNTSSEGHSLQKDNSLNSPTPVSHVDLIISIDLSLLSTVL